MTASATAQDLAAAGRTPTPLAAGTGLLRGIAAVYVGQLSRARVARGPVLVVATVQSVGLLLLLRGFVDGGAGVIARTIVAGSTVLVVAFVALNLLAQRLGSLRAAGGLDYYAALPVAPSAVVLGTVASYATFTVPGSVVTVIVGALVYDLPLVHIWVLVPVLVLAGAALAGLGATLGLLARRPETATLAGQLGMSVVLFLGLIPAERFPLVLRGVRAAVPSTYAVDALAGAMRPHPSWAGVGVDLLVCGVVAVVALVMASWAFRRAVRR